jgi:hypothetical protein
MNTPQTQYGPLSPALAAASLESAKSAVSWGAIIGGAAAAVSASLVLVALGTGLDLTAISPWAGSGVSGTTFTVMTAIWFIVIQWVSSGVGGYLTGRLRTKWVDTHTHEVFFRDTAHGLITWALATLLAALLLVSGATSLIAGGTHIAGTMAIGAAQAAGNPRTAAPGSYDLDVLFRGSTPEANAAGPGPGADPRPEAMRILANGLANGGIPPADRSYLSSLVAARTGISQADAEQRVDSFVERSKAAADSARKTASATAIFTAISMLIGAFIACVAAALGGQRRDTPAVSLR